MDLLKRRIIEDGTELGTEVVKVVIWESIRF